MLALQITSLKILMNQLLTGDTFDIFLLEEAVISTANTHTIDGHINTDFFPPDERDSDSIPYEFQPWSELKGLCFHLIKGKHTPLYFKFVFHLKPEKAAALLERQNNSVSVDNLKAMVLTLRYDGTKAVLTTGTSYHTFVMDKEPDLIWDRSLLKYLSQKGINYETM